MDEPDANGVAAATAAAETTEEATGDSDPSGHDVPGEDAAPPSAEEPLNTSDGGVLGQQCGETFTEEATHRDHLDEHRPESLPLDDQLDDIHKAEKDSESANYCTLCSLSFAKTSEFHLHMEENHGQASQKDSETTKPRPYACPDCGKGYSMLGHLLNHQRTHGNAVKSLVTDLELLKKKSFQCEICGRNYSRASALDAHRRCHEENVFKSRSRNSGDLVVAEEPIVDAKPSENQADFTPEKPFECKCGKTFSAQMGLKTHQRFSRNSLCSAQLSPDAVKEKPNRKYKYHCSECKKSFGCHLALVNHQRWHSNQSSGKASKFQCEECGKAFVSSTFYYKHMHLKHSGLTAAKSFLDQVHQLQKKSFECNECGLKFSRASALHSHQLLHEDVYGERERKRTKNVEVPTETRWIVMSQSNEDSHVYETDEDGASYDPADFNVQVISASESEDEHIQDPNPELELRFETDQDMRGDGETRGCPSGLDSKAEMGLKIVQVDFELPDEDSVVPASKEEDETLPKRFDCPECYRWFSSAGSLGIHRMWHRIRKERRQSGPESTAAVGISGTGRHDGSSSTVAPHCSDTEQHGTQNPTDDVLNQAGDLEKKDMTCGECGKSFSHLSALVSHQLDHPERKRFQCPACMMSYLHAASLFNHMKTCYAQKKENISVSRIEYNPKKTLLGPKSFYCEQCGKGFWSLGAYSHHKQNEVGCAESWQIKCGGETLHSVRRHSRSTVKIACPVCGRMFRHKGIMKLHMRKHENGNHKCDLCPRSFRLFSSLLRHQVVHNDQLLPPPVKSFQHQVDQLKKNSYSCPDCGKLFSRAKALQFHMKSHGYESGIYLSSPRASVMLVDHKCTKCLAHFKSKGSLQAHKKLCSRRENEAVDYPIPPAANDHTVTPQQDSMRPVTQTGSEHLNFSAEAKDEIHSSVGKIGSGTRKYKCKKCDKSFSIVGALNLHSRIHSEHRSKAKLALAVMLKKPKQEESTKGPFPCTACGKMFLTNAALGSHKRLHKGRKLSQSAPNVDELKFAGQKPEDGPFQCNACDKQFFNRRVFQRHQMFNPQCQNDTELDSSETTQSNSVVKNSEFSCLASGAQFLPGSLVQSEYEHGFILEAVDHNGEGLEIADCIIEQVDVAVNGTESTIVTSNIHQCSVCSLVFSNMRDLEDHMWQVHSESSNSQNMGSLCPDRDAFSERGEKNKTDESSPLDYTIKKNSPADNGTVDTVGPVVNSASCFDCGTQCDSAQSLLDHKNECTQEVKQDIQIPESTEEVSPSANHPSELSVKCYYKCNMCGKAFQTEEHLSAHKIKAKSRPYSCALCCHGFWTENQLQQHLAWHDEVRGRLPNEVRYRLGAIATSTPRKPKGPSADNKGHSCSPSQLDQAALKPDAQFQSSHKCQDCGKAFLSPTALEKHESQHCNKDSYHCSICPRTFSEIQDLINHHQECIGGYNCQ